MDPKHQRSLLCLGGLAKVQRESGCCDSGYCREGRNTCNYRVPFRLKLRAHTTKNQLIVAFTSSPGLTLCVPEPDQEPDYEVGFSVLAAQVGAILTSEKQI